MKDIEDVIEDYMKKNISAADFDLLYVSLLEAGYSKEQISGSTFRKLMEQFLLSKNHKHNNQNENRLISGSETGEDRGIPDIDAFGLPDEY